MHTKIATRKQQKEFRWKFLVLQTSSYWILTVEMIWIKKRLSTGYEILRISIVVSIVTILSSIQWAENPTTKLDANLMVQSKQRK